MWSFKQSIYKNRTEEGCQDVFIINNTWTGCNATVTTYSDGTLIPQITDPTAWNDAVTGAWCYYDNDPSTEAVYGKLYNWYAFMGIHNVASATDPSLRKQLAPDGYHSPHDFEWLELFNSLGGVGTAGGPLKEAGTTHWLSPNTDATNTSNFTALPAGNRAPGGYSTEVTQFANFWSTKEIDEDSAWLHTLHYTVGSIYSQQYNKQAGLSVRFVLGSEPCYNCYQYDVPIGTQEWTACNTTISTYRDLTVIPQVQDPTAWANLQTGAWCWYKNNPGFEATYGKLYNWYAVAGIYDEASFTDPFLRKEFAPVGYHVPTAYEADQLFTHLGGASFAGGKMKETGFCHWNSPNFTATNSSNFAGLPGGYRAINGNDYDLNIEGHWWTLTSDPEPSTSAVRYDLHYNEEPVNFDTTEKKKGYSVRFIKGVPCVNCSPHDVPIGTQIWAGCNLNVSSYRNGDPIPYEPDPTAWINLTTGAWCYYNNDPTTEATYGKLYNWYAVNDARGLGPFGYHVPSEAEWITLRDYLGGETAAGTKLKEIEYCHWLRAPIAEDATNSSGFTALPGGRRNNVGGFELLGQRGLFWSTTEYVPLNYGVYYHMGNSHTSLYRGAVSKYWGMSIRLIKD